MRKNARKIKIKPPRKMRYGPSKPLFQTKEIIFRSGARAKALKISSKVQILFLILFFCMAGWAAYSYHIYNKTGTLKSKLNDSRNAYAELMSDFVAVHKNINSMFSLIAEENFDDEEEMKRYKEQALVVEEKIKEIADSGNWFDGEKVEEQTNLRAALLARDRVIAERNALLTKIKNLETSVQKLETAEMEILNKVEKLSETEAQKIRNAITGINQSIKKQNKYFNLFGGGKKSSTGGTFEKAPEVDNQMLSKKMQDVFLKIEDLDYYREIMKTVPVGKPVLNYHVSSPFGHRADPFNKKSATHKGVDLASNKGNIIKVMADGKVIRAEWVTGYGNLLEIDHGNGFKTKYAHLNKMYVKKGQNVEQGDEIGEVGSTGRSTGPHLHYEVLYNGVNVDPMAFITAYNNKGEKI